MKRLYETKISNAKWIAYDLPGNAGWIAYITALILCFVKKPDLTQVPVMKGALIAAVLPALLMLIGIAELICERIKKQDRILPKWQLLLGFGSLTLGGILGAALALFSLLYGAANGWNVALLLLACAGGTLCGLFAGLLYFGYRPAEVR